MTLYRAIIVLRAQSFVKSKGYKWNIKARTVDVMKCGVDTEILQR